MRGIAWRIVVLAVVVRRVLHGSGARQSTPGAHSHRASDAQEIQSRDRRRPAHLFALFMALAAAGTLWWTYDLYTQATRPNAFGLLSGQLIFALDRPDVHAQLTVVTRPGFYDGDLMYVQPRFDLELGESVRWALYSDDGSVDLMDLDDDLDGDYDTPCNGFCWPKNATFLESVSASDYDQCEPPTTYRYQPDGARPAEQACLGFLPDDHVSGPASAIMGEVEGPAVVGDATDHTALLLVSPDIGFRSGDSVTVSLPVLRTTRIRFTYNGLAEQWFAAKDLEIVVSRSMTLGESVRRASPLPDESGSALVWTGASGFSADYEIVDVNEESANRTRIFMAGALVGLAGSLLTAAVVAFREDRKRRRWT